MVYFKPKFKTDISGKMSLYSTLSIITVIIICAAAWNLLDIAKTTYLNTIEGKAKKNSKIKNSSSKNLPAKPVFKKTFCRISFS